jgi:hypothetical protein
MGTPLDFAYSPLDASGFFDDSNFSGLDISKPLKGSDMYDYEDIVQMRKPEPPSRVEVPAKPIGKPLLPQGLPKTPAMDLIDEHIPTVPSQIAKPQVVSKQHQPQHVNQNTMYDAASFNKRFEQEQMHAYVKQMQNNAYYQAAQQQTATAPSHASSAGASGNGYFEKLFSKKKEFFKLIQWVLIITLAISIHFFVKYYMKYYLNSNDLTFEREMILRALYPLGILFILWNLRVFNKA